MSDREYIHGYSKEEQDRLIDQAAYWKDRLILKYANYQPNDSLLEIGCGDGAVLGTIASKYPTMKFSGIDISAEQIQTAKQHLSDLKEPVDLRTGDANNLPWPDNSFDHVYISWVLEHMPFQNGVLSEARRVLKPGGQIRIHETDYATWACAPHTDSFELVRKAWYQYFERAGTPKIGRLLGALLNQAGFREIKNEGLVMNYHKNKLETELKEFVNYIVNFTRPVSEDLAGILGITKTQFDEAILNFENISHDPMGCISVTVHKATAIK